MNKTLLYYYKQTRAHQLATYGNSGLFVNGIDQREFAGGGAAYGFHATAAYQSARRAIHFRNTLATDVKTYEKRSKAAKRGWKTRRDKYNSQWEYKFLP